MRSPSSSFRRRGKGLERETPTRQGTLLLCEKTVEKKRDGHSKTKMLGKKGDASRRRNLGGKGPFSSVKGGFVATARGEVHSQRSLRKDSSNQFSRGGKKILSYKSVT